MEKKQLNYAYIDGANLHKGMASLGWKLDYKRFRIWLREKYSVQKAYLFIGMIPRYHDLYAALQEYGYTLIFKEVVYDEAGKAKGNCDADLVLHTVRDTYEGSFEKALIVSSDGDYVSLVKFLIEKDKFLTILSPGIETRCSVLLRRATSEIVYLDEKGSILKAR